MKSLKKIIWILALAPTTALAKISGPVNPSGLPEKLVGQGGIITKISNAILAVVGVLAVLFLILGGVQYITSAGNPDNVAKAKNTILYAVIGLIFVILSFAIVNFIITRL